MSPWVWLTVLLVAMAAEPPMAPAAVPFSARVDGNAVHLTAPRWKVTIEDGVVVAMENRLTGEVYARRGEGVPRQLPSGLGVQTGAVPAAAHLHGPWVSLSPKQLATDPRGKFPSQHRPYGKSKLQITKPTPTSVRMVYRGLVGGDVEYPDETFELTAAFDADTGDLVLTARGESTGGVYGAAVGVVNLDRSLRASVAHMGGMTFDANWPQGLYGLGDGGPFLEGPVIALEGKAGSAAIWAQDAQFRPKNLLWLNTVGGFAVLWQTRNIMPYEPLRRAESVAWRLNCFRGSWVAALEPYRQWFARTFAAQIARRPAWAAKVRVIIPEMPLPEERMRIIAEAFDPNVVLLHAWSARKPSFDTELPDFTPRQAFIDSVAVAHRLGFHTSAYVNDVCINNDPCVIARYDLKNVAWLRGKIFSDERQQWDKFAPGQVVYTDPLSPAWRALHVRLMKDFVQSTKVDALYEDCAGTDGDFNKGRSPDGLAPLAGTFALLNQTQLALPAGVAFSSEYHVERTAPFDTWALHGIGWGGPAFLRQRERRGRPVNCFIWGPNVMAWIHPGDTDLADAVGGISPIPSTWLGATRGDQGLLAFRARLFASRSLKPSFPKTPWPPDAIAYYEDASGRLYQVRDESGHVMIGPDGKELYRRTRGLAKARTDLCIPGWCAYDADGPIGLDPNWQYSLFPGRRDDTRLRISRLSPGAAIAGYREGAGFIVLTLASVAPEPNRPPTVEMRYRLPEAAAMTLVDGQSVSPNPDADGAGWRLEVPSGATVVFLAGQAAPPGADGWIGDPHHQGVLAPQHGPALALDVLRGKLLETTLRPPGAKAMPAFHAATPPSMRLVFDSVVRVPDANSVLRLYGRHGIQKYGDGQRAMVWINGREIFRTHLPRDDGRCHQWDVPLGRFAGRPVLITIAGDPGPTGNCNCDNLYLTRPRIVPDSAVSAPAHRVFEKPPG